MLTAFRRAGRSAAVRARRSTSPRRILGMPPPLPSVVAASNGLLPIWYRHFCQVQGNDVSAINDMIIGDDIMFRFMISTHCLIRGDYWPCFAHWRQRHFIAARHDDGRSFEMKGFMPPGHTSGFVMTSLLALPFCHALSKRQLAIVTATTLPRTTALMDGRR